MASTAPETRPIAILQAGRALAALAVVMLHARTSTAAFVAPLPGWFDRAAGLGYLGVDFFFVLSGFIIFYTNAGRAQRPGWRRRFAESRLVRIFVPYLPVGIGLALVYTFLPTLSLRPQDWGWFSTLTLIPSGSAPALPVAWTLEHELVFYALAFLFLQGSRPLLLAGLWAAAIVGWRLVFGLLDGPPTLSVAAVFLHPINLEFLFGMVAAWAILHRRFDRPLALSALGCLFVALFFATGENKQLSFLFGLGIACFVPVLVRLETAGGFQVAGWLLVLGDASYALYLIHNPLISVTSRLVARVTHRWPAAILLGLAASVAASLVFYWIYERPARRWVRARLSGRRSEGLERPAVNAGTEL
ncbi:MAG TPA: acyltransferase [Allosphingosinicella sp.]|nr:acyltransferase [Allosphingosinicella sp.]